MAQQEDKPIVVTPFVPDARLEVHDFRPTFREVQPGPKASSAPAPVAKAAPRKRAPKKAPTKTAPTKAVSSEAPGSGEIVIVEGELPPA